MGLSAMARLDVTSPFHVLWPWVPLLMQRLSLLMHRLSSIPCDDGQKQRNLRTLPTALVSMIVLSQSREAEAICLHHNCFVLVCECLLEQLECDIDAAAARQLYQALMSWLYLSDRNGPQWRLRLV